MYRWYSLEKQQVPYEDKLVIVLLEWPEQNAAVFDFAKMVRDCFAFHIRDYPGKLREAKFRYWCHVPPLPIDSQAIAHWNVVKDKPLPAGVQVVAWDHVLQCLGIGRLTKQHGFWADGVWDKHEYEWSLRNEFPEFWMALPMLPKDVTCRVLETASPHS